MSLRTVTASLRLHRHRLARALRLDSIPIILTVFAGGSVQHRLSAVQTHDR
jgi:hypothetical protein